MTLGSLLAWSIREQQPMLLFPAVDEGKITMRAQLKGGRYIDFEIRGNSAIPSEVKRVRS